MKNIVIFLCIYGMKFLYFFIKIFKTRNKITFISRQGNQNSIDFELVQKELRRLDKEVDIVVLNRRFRDTDSLFIKIKYCFHILVQMYHIATSKVVVLESYCMPISILKHKKSLKVVQMWHALGSLKKFGYSIVDRKEGSSLVHIAKMHKNYDIILTSSLEARKNFAEAFQYTLRSFAIIPLPRVDYLMDRSIQNKLSEKIREEYPILNNKKNIVYAPTFRKNGEDIEKIMELISCIDYRKYNLILKLHPLTKIEIKDKNPLYDKKYPTIDWLNIADIVITDYSAIVYEAALLNKKIILYAYDLGNYEINRDFYLNYRKDMVGILAPTTKDIVQALEMKGHDRERTEIFSKKYVDYHGQNCTKKLANLILKLKRNG